MPLSRDLAFRRLTLALMASAGSVCAGCSGPPLSESGFDSPDPGGRIYAIVRAARQDDRTKIPQLVRSLDSDDPAVRMMASDVLERMTQQTLGYHAYDDQADRDRAVARWSDWLAQQSAPVDKAAAPIDAPGRAAPPPAQSAPPPASASPNDPTR